MGNELVGLERGDEGESELHGIGAFTNTCQISITMLIHLRDVYVD
jgi:hypothetical protein